MASITDTGIAIAARRPTWRQFHSIQAFYRLMRRHWRLRLWESRMRQELGDDRLLADIGVAPGVERRRMAALARALGASSQRGI